VCLESIHRWEITRSGDPDEFTLFVKELETDPLVLFHTSPASNLAPILDDGFRSAADLGVGSLESVSYSKSSNFWCIVANYPAAGDFAIFAVRFDTLDQCKIQVNECDIHVYSREIQPEILGYCEIQKGYPCSHSS
jgi:hypothetical protein